MTAGGDGGLGGDGGVSGLGEGGVAGGGGSTGASLSGLEAGCFPLDTGGVGSEPCACVVPLEELGSVLVCGEVWKLPGIILSWGVVGRVGLLRANSWVTAVRVCLVLCRRCSTVAVSSSSSSPGVVDAVELLK